MKRKRVDEDSMEVDDDSEGNVKRARGLIKPTATEMVEKLMMDVSE
jgi:hypothetical protein